MINKIISAEQAIEYIRDGDSIMVGGFGLRGWSLLTPALSDSDLVVDHPRRECLLEIMQETQIMISRLQRTLLSWVSWEMSVRSQQDTMGRI